MNILKLAKHLKEFTLDEIEMIAEENCKTKLIQLLNVHKLSVNNGLYKFVKKRHEEYSIFINKKSKNENYEFAAAVHDFLENYAKKYCKKETIHYYQSTFNNHIVPYFKNKKLQNIDIDTINGYYKNCLNRNLPAHRVKNILALLNQLIKYYRDLGIIDTKCVFQVRRLTAKNEFSENRLIFKENL